MITAKERYKLMSAKLGEYIREHGLRNTQERLIILRLMTEVKQCPFTVDHLKDGIEKEHISLGTLYNTIDLFISARILYSISREHGATVTQYNWVGGKSNQMQYVCTMCGRTVHFNDKAVQQILTDRKYNNFIPAQIEITVYGECKYCRNGRNI